MREVFLAGTSREFLTILASDNVTRTTDNVFVVLEMDKILEQEMRLAQDYRYPMTDTAKEIVRMTSVQQSLETVTA